MKRAIIGLLLLAAIAAAAIGLLELRPRIAAITAAPGEPVPAKYAEAKELIGRARTLLTEVVREHPGTANAYFAKLQLAALSNIFKTDVPVAPVTLEGPVVWRIKRVEMDDAYTKVTVEIENTSETNAESFHAFDRHPLALLANKTVHTMKKSTLERPANVSQYNDDRWLLQPTQAITLDVYFDAAAPGAVDGMLKYVNDYMREEPARFSLMNVHQNAAPR